MSAIQLREGVWSVGVLNPALRVFDIVMESRYGTSYNAYLVTGGEKTALIEAVHKDYFEDLVSNIEEILPVEKLDYLIMNHTEPDHSGGVRALLDRCPNLTVLCSSSAKKFLTSIANEEFPCRVVKDGDTLDLGGKTLRFISAPLLHWPDSIFTWDEADKTLFTCDFLGCHFCEPSMRIPASIRSSAATMRRSSSTTLTVFLAHSSPPCWTAWTRCPPGWSWCVPATVPPSPSPSAM